MTDLSKFRFFPDGHELKCSKDQLLQDVILRPKIDGRACIGCVSGVKYINEIAAVTWLVLQDFMTMSDMHKPLPRFNQIRCNSGDTIPVRSCQ